MAAIILVNMWILEYSIRNYIYIYTHTHTHIWLSDLSMFKFYPSLLDSANVQRFLLGLIKLFYFIFSY